MRLMPQTPRTRHEVCWPEAADFDVVLADFYLVTCGLFYLFKI